METTYQVPEVHCAACTASIRKAVESVDGFQEVMVDLDRKQVTVRFDETQADAASFKERTERAGFDVD